MDRQVVSKLEPDKPQSISDGAITPLQMDCGCLVRLPAQMDYRLAAILCDKYPEMTDAEIGLSMLYFALHIEKGELGQLWKQAMHPARLKRAVFAWADTQPPKDLVNAFVEYQSLEAVLSKEYEEADADKSGKPVDWMALAVEFAMEKLNMDRMEAAWFIPAGELYRMQKAHLENNGESQNWGKSRLDKVMEMDDSEQS